MRRICGCDGYGVPQAKRSAIFFLNLKVKDPESIAAKIMVEYNSIGLFPKSTCKFLHPEIGIFFS